MLSELYIKNTEITRLSPGRGMILLLTAIAIIFGPSLIAEEGANAGLAYTSKRVSGSIFMLDFTTDGTKYFSAQGEDYAILRCAEVCLDNNFKYFAILKSNLNLPTTDCATCQEEGRFVHITHNYGHSSFRIRCFNEMPGDLIRKVFDASQVALEIKQKYGIIKE